MAELKDGIPTFPASIEQAASMGGFGAPAMPLRDYFAAHAPDVPHWFERQWITQIVPIGNGMVGPREVQETTDAQFFRWRWYYADAMLKSRQS